VARQTAESKAKTAKLKAQILEFKQLGLSFRAIASKLNCSVGNVHKHYTNMLKELQAENLKQAESYQFLQLQRLEALILPLHVKANKGDVSAAMALVRVYDSITKLVGADAPTKIAPTTPDGKSPYDPMAMSAEERAKRIAELEKKMGKKK
jgi:hypothetical protein